MATIADRFVANVEASYPMLLGAIGAAASFVYAPDAIAHMIAAKWSVGAVYSSVFNVAAITTPFLFTFYSFVVTTDRGFIGRAKGSVYYAATVRFTVWALIFGAALTLASIPMIVIEPKPSGISEWSNLALAAWVGFAIWTFGAFVRAAFLFSIFVQQHR